MKPSIKMVIIILVVMLLAVMLLAACGGGDDETKKPTPVLIPSITPTSTPTPTLESPPITTPTPTLETSEDVVITIGNHTDMTGVASNAMSILTMAMKDTAKYYNEQNLIPGVTLEVITYDGGYDPSRDVSGYEWLKYQGADLIWSPVGGTTVNLKPFVEEDKMVLITLSPQEDTFVPPGWVFALGSASYDEQISTLMKWVAENDPDFPKDRPARVGGAMWNESVGVSVLGSAEKYAKANSDQYQWVGGHLTDFSFIWDAEAAALKNCDYVFPSVPPVQFVKKYREIGGTGKFLGTEAHVAFMRQIDDAFVWDQMDGMFVVLSFTWWNEDDELIDLTKQLLYENHPVEANDIIRSGVGYITVQPVYIMLEAIRETVEEVGPEDFTSEALYNHLQSFTITVDGCHHSITAIKRTSNNELGIHELRADEKNLCRISTEWIPIQR